MCILLFELTLISLGLVATLLASSSLEGFQYGFDTECGHERISRKGKPHHGLTRLHS